MNIMLKLQERSPVNSVMVRKEAKRSEMFFAKFESLVNKLFKMEYFTTKEADRAKSQYDDFLGSVVH